MKQENWVEVGGVWTGYRRVGRGGGFLIKPLIVRA
jgi:hypothetical protein